MWEQDNSVSRIKAEKASLEKIVKNHDSDSKILERSKPNPVSAAQDENA